MSSAVRAPDGLTATELEQWVDEQLANYARKGIVIPPPRAAEAAPLTPERASLLAGIGEVAVFREPAAAPSPCRAGCGVVVELPGVCSACAARARDAEIELYFAPARASIPDEFAWIRRAGAELRERCPVRTESGTVNPRAVAWRSAMDLIERRKLIVAISSPASGNTSRAGKSVLAARIMYSVIDRGQAFAAQHWPLSVPEPEAVSVARRCRWVQAVSLADRPEQGQVSAFDRALEAPLIVLNDLGQEDAEGFGGAERRAASKKLVILRWDLGRPTMITHALAASEIATGYGGGVHGRMLCDVRSATIFVEALTPRSAAV